MTDVTDAAGRAAFLEKSLLAVVGKPFTLEQLATVLFHIMQISKIPKPAMEAIRAVAFLLEEKVHVKMAMAVTKWIAENLPNEITTHVVAAISPQLVDLLCINKDFKLNVNSLQSSHQEVIKSLTGKVLTPMVERISTATTNISDSLLEIKKTVSHLLSSLKTTQDGINSIMMNLTNHSPSSQNAQCSYSNAVRSQPPPASLLSHPPLSNPATVALARAAIRQCQVLLDPASGHSLHLPDQSNMTIAFKFKAIMDNIKDDNAPQMEIKVIICLKNGGLILEFNSIEAINWLHLDKNKAKFLVALDFPTEIKEQSYTILVPFLSISSPLDDPTWLHTIELENDICPGSLVSARWIKVIAKQNPNQRYWNC